MKSGQNGNTKVWMLVAALAVAIAAVVFFGSNYPPDSEMASGTIVPAERYRADQITSDDVMLGDESIAQFMQTDEFELLVNDEIFMEAISQDAFQAALNDQNFQAALGDSNFMAA